MTSILCLSARKLYFIKFRYGGTGRMSGTLSSFLCAVRDDSNPAIDIKDQKYISFAKFGTGFQRDSESIDQISLESRKFDSIRSKESS